MIRFNHAPDGFAIATKTAGHEGGYREDVEFNPKTDVVIANVDAGGKLLGGVTLEKFNGASILMHVAGFSPSWLTRDFLWVIFHWPFVQLGCSKVIALVSSGNLAAIDFDKRIGFKEEARIKDADPLGDTVILTMRREDCRWLNYIPKSIRPRKQDVR